MKARIITLIGLLLVNTVTFAPVFAGQKDSSNTNAKAHFRSFLSLKEKFTVNLDFQGNSQEPVYVKLYNKDNDLVFFKTVTGNIQEQMDVSEFPIGNYELVIKSAGYIKKQVFSIQDYGVKMPEFNQTLEVKVLKEENGSYRVAMTNTTNAPVTIQITGEDNRVIHSEVANDSDLNKTYSFVTAETGDYDFLIQHNGSTATQTVRIN